MMWYGCISSQLMWLYFQITQQGCIIYMYEDHLDQVNILLWQYGASSTLNFNQKKIKCIQPFEYTCTFFLLTQGGSPYKICLNSVRQMALQKLFKIGPDDLNL